MPGPQTIHFGGNTTCIELRAGNQIIVLDAGTGARQLGSSLVEEFGGRSIDVTILLSHTHLDHIQGLPFFAPLFGSGNRVRIMGNEDIATALAQQISPPYFPFRLEKLAADIRIEGVPSSPFALGEVTVSATCANHAGNCLAYRLATPRGAVAFVPDNEWPAPGNSVFANEFSAFVRDADVLIIDAQYTAREYQSRKGWGHGCIDDVTALAGRERVKHLILFHHDPEHDDYQIHEIVRHARELAADAGLTMAVSAAREGMEILL